MATSNYSYGAEISGMSTPGDYTKEGGFYAYYEICGLRKNGALLHLVRDPFVVFGKTWVGFDNQMSIFNKMGYIKYKNLGGAMIWSLPLDDFSGTQCGQGKYPLTKVIARKLRFYHETDESNINRPMFNGTILIALFVTLVLAVHRK
ncbi:chitotriosidase-1-like [Tubulanus polymorphus]|uniref:chitotriosidase-1-like n=1 Tax=Tubulanus polymorphus TaxID=672921 RepID=UPI003DA594A8